MNVISLVILFFFFFFFFSPSLSSHQCSQNPPKLDGSSGIGSVIEIGGLKSYVSGSTGSKLAIILVSDIYGYEAPNLRKLADKVANAGFYALVPDFLHGDPYNASDPKRSIPVWKSSHPPEKEIGNAKQIVAALRSKGISAVGAAGFCWGAKLVVMQAASNDIQAAVLLHPSNVTVADVKEVIKPIAILAAELDNGTPPELLKQFDEALSPQVDRFIKIFPGVKHGWTIRYNATDAQVVKSAEEAHQDMLNWFIKHVK